MSARLLLVDDDAAARRMMRRVLERRGYDVSECGDGRAGLDQVRATRPDGVLLDLRMPGELSGFDVARELKADPATAGIPIIVVCASTHLDARSMVDHVGCDAFLEKPVDFDELDRVLAEVITPR
jgi:CheY-like chemotaxis protein